MWDFTTATTGKRSTRGNYFNKPPYTGPYVRWWCVTNEEQKTVRRCYTNDEGSPLGVGVQAQASNHLVRLRLKGEVVSDKEKMLLRYQVGVKETNENELLKKCR